MTHNKYHTLKRCALFYLLGLTVLLFAVPKIYAQQTDRTLLIATTTSIQDSGLLDTLAPIFTKEKGISLKWVSVGTGKALTHGKQCDVDAVLVHAKAAEEAFVQAGYGIHRLPFMYNSFIIVGPKEDTAKTQGQKAHIALQYIARAKAHFISRGDYSGTHRMEEKLWRNADLQIPEKEKWYLSVGQGMMHTLNIASEKKAYTLTDRGTWIHFHSKNPQSPLTVLVQDDAELFNQYSVIEVNPQHCPQAQQTLAAKFSEWLATPTTQKHIADYHIQGQQLFFPNAAPDTNGK